jgi:hypothetical protein
MLFALTILGILRVWKNRRRTAAAPQKNKTGATFRFFSQLLQLASSHRESVKSISTKDFTVEAQGSRNLLGACS